MPWKHIRGHDALVDHFRNLMVAGRFPHALLFVGPQSVGKNLFARTLAQAVLCEKNSVAELNPCETCPGCRQVMGETHPDLIVVRRPEDKQFLPVSAIRDLCGQLALKPMMGKYRVAIIEDADYLNEESANAFLKTLEEPGAGSILILIGTSPDTQLDTVVSRCQVVRFQPLSAEDIEAILIERSIITQAADAHRLAQQAEGSIARAIALADQDYIDARRAILHELVESSVPVAPRVAKLMEELAKSAGKESAAQRRRAVLILEDLCRFLRDVLWTGAGMAAPSGDTNWADSALNLARACQPEDIFAAIDRCLLGIAQIQSNAYLPIALTATAHDVCKIMFEANRPAPLKSK